MERRRSSGGAASTAEPTAPKRPVCDVNWLWVLIKLDAFHAMARVEKPLHKTHGLYNTFLTRFRDAMFIPDASQLKAIKQIMVNSGVEQVEVDRRYKEDYASFLDKVCRTIPPPEMLMDRLLALEEVYAGALDHKTGDVFFSKAVWKEWEALKLHVAAGCLSDHPDIPM